MRHNIYKLAKFSYIWCECGINIRGKKMGSEKLDDKLRLFDALSGNQEKQVDKIVADISEKVFGDPEDPDIFFEGFSQLPDGLDLEENLRFCGKKIEEAAQKAAGLIDSSVELKDIFKEDYASFKKIMISEFKISGLGMVLPMPGTMPSWIMQYVFKKCENDFEGKTREEIKKNIDCAMEGLSELLCEEVKEIGLNDELLNMIHGLVYDSSIPDEELNEFLGIDTLLFFYVKEIPYKQGIPMQDTVDELFDEYQDVFHGLTKDAIKKCLEPAIAKNTELILANGMICRIEGEPSDTMIPLAWAAEQLKDYFVISKADVDYIESSRSWAQDVNYHTSTRLLEQITRVLKKVYSGESSSENDFYELTQERFEELINGQGKSKMAQRDAYVCYGFWINFLEVNTEDERKNYVNGLKELIYSRLDKGNRINFCDELELERDGNNIRIRAIEKTDN